MRRSVRTRPASTTARTATRTDKPNDQVGVVLYDAVVDDGAQDQGVDRTDCRIEDDDGDEDGQDLPVGDGEGEHAPCRPLLDVVLQDRPVLAKGAHAAQGSAAPTPHAVSAHRHGCNLPSTCDGSGADRLPNVCPTAVCGGVPGGLHGVGGECARRAGSLDCCLKFPGYRAEKSVGSARWSAVRAMGAANGPEVPWIASQRPPYDFPADARA